ncbi:DUF6125 family protein [Paucidesulfovibrio longus]|uniref:DUF6125 family protein n=1 Tax=Paucidesulfovibrio longus TaxID=889 RepID=UPI0003B52943|nr:DUF6125 family protein [Paucidesulfovibrio longus]
MAPEFDLFLLEDMDKYQVREYVSTLLWQIRICDAFWFLNVEQRHGLAEAEKINELVWDKVGALAARDIVERFGPFEDSPRGFWEAYEYLCWSPMVEYQVEEEEDALTVTVRSCPAQAGRRKHGLGPYACREMHGGEYRRFAELAAPSVRVECVHAPPDDTERDYDCRWRFAARKSGD